MYSRTNLKSQAQTLISGTIADADLIIACNEAVREVLSDADLRSAKRQVALSPDLFNDVYDYSCPSDFKSLIDVKPQGENRSIFSEVGLTTEAQFDRMKGSTENEIQTCIATNNLVRTLRISMDIDDQNTIIDQMDDADTWHAYGDGTNLTDDSDYYIKGAASINWDISAVGGTTAGIYKDDITSFDISKYLTSGSIFTWHYVSVATNITNYKIRIGSDASNYYEITITTNNEGVAFYAGWNLLRFAMSAKTTTGTPDDDAITYVAIFMTKDGAKVSETDFRFNWLAIKIGEQYRVTYYSKYGWQNTSGTYLENSTADADYLNYDTDEIRLIKYKTAELAERKLRNYAQANELLKVYTNYLTGYLSKNPSESLLLMTSYDIIN